MADNRFQKRFSQLLGFIQGRAFGTGSGSGTLKSEPFPSYSDSIAMGQEFGGIIYSVRVAYAAGVPVAVSGTARNPYSATVLMSKNTTGISIIQLTGLPSFLSISNAKLKVRYWVADVSGSFTSPAIFSVSATGTGTQIAINILSFVEDETSKLLVAADPSDTQELEIELVLN